MPIAKIFSFLTYPKNVQAVGDEPSGTEIPLDDGKLCTMLSNTFRAAPHECTVPIAFMSDGVDQQNDVRDELLALVRAPTVRRAALLGTRLQQATSGSSGMGLLFICIGNEDEGKTRLVISRFPADEGVVAERARDQLTVSFVEQVFLKSSHSYKAATYLYEGRPNDLWSGNVVDKQLNHGSKSVADYWIIDFLKSDFATTPAAGTKRLAVALKAALTVTADPSIKSEITSAVKLANNMPARALTISAFCDIFHFSPSTKTAVCAAVTPARLIDEKFRFSQEEFARHIAFKQIELDNGAILSAPSNTFNECFERVETPNGTTFKTTGLVVDERLRRSK